MREEMCYVHEQQLTRIQKLRMWLTEFLDEQINFLIKPKGQSGIWFYGDPEKKNYEMFVPNFTTEDILDKVRIKLCAKIPHEINWLVKGSTKDPMDLKVSVEWHIRDTSVVGCTTKASSSNNRLEAEAEVLLQVLIWARDKRFVTMGVREDYL